MVLSILAYSLSASAAKASNTRFHTPFLDQRENRVWIGVAEALRQVGPWNAGAIAVKDSFPEQSVVPRRHANVAFPPRQQIFSSRSA